MTFKDGDTQRNVQVPKGDVFHQFREDVKNDKLPTVSWLVAPERLSDHPESAWYGAWFVSEALHILTENPELWKKTIFILTYDENDGYFDHVPPFVRAQAGASGNGIYLQRCRCNARLHRAGAGRQAEAERAAQSPIGLGYRVPLVVASPWSRGGCVCSQVFDNTSVLQFLENFLTHKTGKPIKETNITSWRRTVAGDLTSVFQSASDQKEKTPTFLQRDPHVQQIYEAQFKPLPTGFKVLTKDEIEKISQDPQNSEWMSQQEPGVRRSSPLPYELYVDGSLSADRSRFTIHFKVGKDRFGERSAGSPFVAYARTGNDDMTVRHYAVAAGEAIEDSWAWPTSLEASTTWKFTARTASSANSSAPRMSRIWKSKSPTAAPATVIRLRAAPSKNCAANHDEHRACNIEIADLSYKNAGQKQSLAAGATAVLAIDTQKSFRWYDFSIKTDASEKFHRRCCGRVETGDWSMSDPAMGRVVS